MYDEGVISSHKLCIFARLSSLCGKVNICAIRYKGLIGVHELHG